MPRVHITSSYSGAFADFRKKLYIASSSRKQNVCLLPLPEADRVSIPKALEEKKIISTYGAFTLNAVLEYFSLMN